MNSNEEFKIKVLIADDSSLFRHILIEALKLLKDVEVIGQANNGKLAISRIKELSPDLITLDIEMPDMDGISVLQELHKEGLNSEVLIISSVTKKGGELSLKAIQMGAFDFITKPEGSNVRDSIELIASELKLRINALKYKIISRSRLRNNKVINSQMLPVNGNKAVATANNESALHNKDSTNLSVVNNTSYPKMKQCELIVVGVSTGGPNALISLLTSLPDNIGVPILIVQHMPPIFTVALADNLNSKCKLTVKEAQHGDILQNNIVYIAPGGKQMRLMKGLANGKVIHITNDPPENNCKPSVDYMFKSVANSFPGVAMALILTGMGADGTVGLKMLKRMGSFVIAQNEASCVVYGMPKAAYEAGVTDVVLDINEIGNKIMQVLKRGV